MATATAHRPLSDAPDLAREVIVEARPEQASAMAEGDSRLRAWRIGDGDAAPVEIANEDLLEALNGDTGLVWIDLSGYRDDGLRRLGEALQLNPLGVRTALAPWRRPGLDAFENHSLVSVTIVVPDPESRKVHIDELDLFVAEHFVLSTHARPLPFEQNVLGRIGGGAESLARDTPFLLYIILEEHLEHYERVTEHLEEEIELMEERALRDSSDAFLSDLVKLKRYVFTITRLADQHRAVFSGLLRPDFPFTSGDSVAGYFRDLDRRYSSRMEALMAAREGVNGAFDIYVSSVSHRTNHIMKLLTIVSAILLPAIVIFGFFGVNFTEVAIFQPWGFYLMLAMVAGMTVSLLALFRRSAWI